MTTRGRGARASTNLTKSEEKERLLVVHKVARAGTNSRCPFTEESVISLIEVSIKREYNSIDSLIIIR